jgi:hypothetical protein
MSRWGWLLSIIPALLWGQWPPQLNLNLPTTADGHVNLAAPAPKTPDSRPDLSGMWRIQFGPNFFDVAKDLQPEDTLPWAEKLHQQRLVTPGKDQWTVLCLPGGPALGLDRQIAKIVQTPELVLILYEDLTYRQIFLDGRELPKDANPTTTDSSGDSCSRPYCPVARRIPAK